MSGCFAGLTGTIAKLLSNLIVAFINCASRGSTLNGMLHSADPGILVKFFTMFTLVPTVTEFLFNVVLVFFGIRNGFGRSVVGRLRREHLREMHGVARRRGTLRDSRAGNRVPVGTSG